MQEIDSGTPPDCLLQTVHHKADRALPTFRKYFHPIQVGFVSSSHPLGIPRDDQGDNIAIKNKSYCELTAMYWAWKNTDHPFYGLMHYRRMFSARGSCFASRIHQGQQISRAVKERLRFHTLGFLSPESRVITRQAELEEECESLQRYLSTRLPTCDAILPDPVYCHHLTMAQQYSLVGCRSDYLSMLDCITSHYPDMKDAAVAASQSHSFCICNMYIMRREVFQDYCERLFAVLKEVERRIDLRWRTPYDLRVFGFLSERFMNIYFRYRSLTAPLRVVHLPTVFLELR